MIDIENAAELYTNTYPKTYEECAEIIAELTGSDCNPKGCMGYMSVQLTALQKLLICRDAYWHTYGEVFNWDNALYYIYTNDYGDVIESDDLDNHNHILGFPNAETRDAFRENFDSDIEICKGLL